MRPEYFFGVDLGQRRDRTAFAILERSQTVAAIPDPITWERARSTHHQVRHLERFPIGTAYTVVIQRIERLGRMLANMGACNLIVDATGVGLPVIDALRIPGAPWRLMPVTITYGVSEAWSDGLWRVPKRDLIAGLQLAFENNHFTIAKDLKDTPALVEELTSMRANHRVSGATQYGSPDPAHDDLAMALALSWWAVETRRPNPLGVNKPVL